MNQLTTTITDLGPKTAALRIFDPNGSIDPVTVFMVDHGDKIGELFVSCYSRAWSCYWGSMQQPTVAEFMRGVEVGYVVNCLVRANRDVITSREVQSRDEAYLTKIVESIVEALDRRAAAESLAASVSTMSDENAAATTA